MKGSHLDGDRRRSPDTSGTVHQSAHGLPGNIALAHVQLETIHPFLDGNGRIGRLLITFLLTERGMLHKPVLYLSHYFKQHRQTYYEHWQAVRDQGAWEAWLAFFLRAAITAQLGRAAGNGHKVLESLFDRPIVAVHDVQKMT